MAHALLYVLASSALAVDTGNGGDTGGCRHAVLIIDPERCLEGESVALQPQMCTGDPLPEGTVWYLSWDAPGVVGRDESASPTSWLCPEIDVESLTDGLMFTLYAELYQEDARDGVAWGNVAVLDKAHLGTEAPTDQEGCSADSSCAAGGRERSGGPLGMLIALALGWVRRTRPRAR